VVVWKEIDGGFGESSLPLSRSESPTDRPPPRGPPIIPWNVEGQAVASGPGSSQGEAARVNDPGLAENEG